MDDLNSYATCYLERLKGPEWEQAYHILIEADDAVIPLLIDAFRVESDPATRAIVTSQKMLYGSTRGRGDARSALPHSPGGR
jgi:hypothetical protein